MPHGGLPLRFTAGPPCLPASQPPGLPAQQSRPAWGRSWPWSWVIRLISLQNQEWFCPGLAPGTELAFPCDPPPPQYTHTQSVCRPPNSVRNWPLKNSQPLGPTSSSRHRVVGPTPPSGTQDGRAGDGEAGVNPPRSSSNHDKQTLVSDGPLRSRPTLRQRWGPAATSLSPALPPACSP